MGDEGCSRLRYEWRFWARPEQLAPEGNWFGWLLLAGRGFGKTRTANEYIRDEVFSGRHGRIGIISETAADGRDVMVEGETGIMNISPPWFMPHYEPSKRRITWPNGAVATLFDAREPDQLRGPQFDLVVMDELAKYRYAQEVFDGMLYGLRLGDNPRWIAATTPRPTKLIKELIKDPSVHVTRGSSNDNLANLASSFKKYVIDRVAGTRQGRQEIDAEILEDTPGALWNKTNLDEYRVKAAPTLKRIVVGVDPAASSGEDANDTGIVVVGISEDNVGYVLDDFTVNGPPNVWAKKVVMAFNLHQADRVVAEINNGGEMVEATLRTVASNLPISVVRASRGKYARAEPISALYEQGRVRHVGVLPALEDQMTQFTHDYSQYSGEGASPDRVDALVWACAELFPSLIRPIRTAHREYREAQPLGWLG